VLSSDTILGIKNRDFFTDDCKIAYAILTQNYDYLPCGTPVMVAVKKQRTLACINVFPARASTSYGYTWLPENVLKFIDKVPLHETHKVKNVEEFDYSQFSTIIKSVKEYGGISFVSNKKATAVSIIDSIKSIVREYKHSSLFQFNIYGGRFLSGKDDDLLSVISFFDFTHCIPLFNLKKVDGMGISFTQVLRKHSQLIGKQVNTFRIDIVVSNHSDNLFTIDGATIDQEYKITDALYREIRSRIKTDLPIHKAKLKLKSKKQSKYTIDEAVCIGYDKSVEEVQSPPVVGHVEVDEVQSLPISEPIVKSTPYSYHNHIADAVTSSSTTSY